MGRPGSFLPGVEPNPGGFGALIGSLGWRRPGVLRISGGFGGAICRSFGERFIGAPCGALSRPRWIGGPGSRPSGNASGVGSSGVIGSDGSRWPGVDSGVGSSEAGVSPSAGFVAGVVGLGRAGCFGTAFGALGGVACAKAFPFTPQTTRNIDTHPTASEVSGASGGVLSDGRGMVSSSRAVARSTATTANHINLRELRSVLAKTFRRPGGKPAKRGFAPLCTPCRVRKGRPWRGARPAIGHPSGFRPLSSSHHAGQASAA